MLILHVISGFVSLLCGAVAIFTKKGKGVHIYAGRIYFWSMIAVAITALYLSVVYFLPFLFLVAIFSYYLTWTGFKSIHWKNNPLTGIVYWFDAIVIHLAGLFGLIMILFALLSLFGIHVHETISSLKIVLLVFGVGTSIFAWEDVMIFHKGNHGSRFLWMYMHIGRMLGAYIATFTAFLVVNGAFFPSPLIAWLGPTIIGTPLIFYWIRKYRSKMEPTTTTKST